MPPPWFLSTAVKWKLLNCAPPNRPIVSVMCSIVHLLLRLYREKQSAAAAPDPLIRLIGWSHIKFLCSCLRSFSNCNSKMTFTLGCFFSLHKLSTWLAWHIYNHSLPLIILSIPTPPPASAAQLTAHLALCTPQKSPRLLNKGINNNEKRTVGCVPFFKRYANLHNLSLF